MIVRKSKDSDQYVAYFNIDTIEAKKRGMIYFTSDSFMGAINKALEYKFN